MPEFGSPSSEDRPTRHSRFPVPTWMIVLGAVLAILLVAISYNLKISASGEKLQNGLNAQYGITQVELGNCLDKSAVAAGVATALTKAQRDILTAAVTGRYQDKATGTSTASRDAQSQQKAYVSAVVEAYPDLSEVSKTFQNVLIIITTCRDKYNGTQQKLQVQIASYDDWVDGKNITNYWGKSRFPTHGLEARDPGYGNVEYGQDALERMKSVIVVKDAGDAYRNGELKDQSGDLFNDDEKVTAPAATP